MCILSSKRPLLILAIIISERVQHKHIILDDLSSKVDRRHRDIPSVGGPKVQRHLLEEQ